eukprot:jgi/Tetstr1/448154/TSEL_035447.t2
MQRCAYFKTEWQFSRAKRRRAAVLDEFLVTQRGVEAEGFFMAPSGDTLRACAVVDDAIAAWALCLYVRGYLRDANKAWLQSSCEDRGTGVETGGQEKNTPAPSPAQAAPPPDGLCICGECTGEPQGALWCGELVESCVGSCGGTWWAALALALVLAV